MRKTILKIHRWLAVPFGIIISVLCLTGAILVFQDEILHAVNSEIYHIEVPKGGMPLSEDLLEERVAAQLPDELTLAYVVPGEQPTDPVLVAVEERDDVEFYANPYTGDYYGELRGSAFFAMVKSIHRFLIPKAESEKGGATAVGRMLTGASAVAMSVLLLTGIILWWPRNRKVLKNRLSVSFRKGFRRFVYDSHVSLGIYVVLFLLLMSLTGPAWSFPWYEKAVRALFGENYHLLFFPLHFGQWGGMLTRILYVIAALVGASLPWTGYYLWWKRVHARKK